MLKRLLHDLDIWYFPEFAPGGPAPKVAAEQDRTQKTDTVETHKVAGRTFQVHDDDTWTRHKPGDGYLVEHITERDQAEMGTHDLDLDKYTLIKWCMCNQMTAQEASD